MRLIDADAIPYREYLQMSEIERAANPTTEEAIKYLERMLFTQDFSPSTLRAKAVNTMAIEALREKQERSKGCEHCRGWDSRCGANYCPMCGKELEAHNDNT